MAGTILCPGKCLLHNVPNLVDIKRMGQILTSLGVGVNRDEDTLEIDATQINPTEAPYDVVSQLLSLIHI